MACIPNSKGDGGEEGTSWFVKSEMGKALEPNQELRGEKGKEAIGEGPSK